MAAVWVEIFHQWLMMAHTTCIISDAITLMPMLFHMTLAFTIF
jgi:hypothetical protein